MSTIDDTLAPLDTDTLIEHLADRGVFCQHSGDVFPAMYDAEVANLSIRLGRVDDNYGRPVLEVKGCSLKTLVAIVDHIDRLRRYRINNE